MSYQQTVSEFRDAIFDLIAETTGSTEIYPARTGFIKPTVPYVTYRIVNMTPLEREGRLPDTETEKNITYLVYEVMVDIQAIDPNPNSLSGSSIATCSLIRHGLDMHEVKYKHLILNNIGYLRSSTISDTSSVLDGEQWEQRAAFTCIFNIIVKQSDVLDTSGAIETVRINEENIELPDGSIVDPIANVEPAIPYDEINLN